MRHHDDRAPAFLELDTSDRTEIEASARLTVARHATDADDLALLLNMLELDGTTAPTYSKSQRARMARDLQPETS